MNLQVVIGKAWL